MKAAILEEFGCPLVVEEVELLPPGPNQVVVRTSASAFLGTQGDPWDAQKDMFMATIGGLLAMIVTALINLHKQRDFAREWSASLREKPARGRQVPG